MKEKYNTIGELKSPFKITDSLYFRDLIFVLAYSVITFFIGKNFVHPYLMLPYGVNCLVWAVIFCAPSKMNPKKRNWQSLLLYIGHYHVSYKAHHEVKQREKGEREL